MRQDQDKSRVIVHQGGGFTINASTFHVDEKYQPLDVIGQGSYGVVCSVRNQETQEKLAIKKITPMAGDEWDATHTLREIRLMRCLGVHENVRTLLAIAPSPSHALDHLSQGSEHVGRKG